MAKTHPKFAPRNFGEKTALRCMEKHLDDSYTIISNYTYDFIRYDKKFKKEVHENGEMDFIICHQDLGLVFVEVKSGTIEEDEKGFCRVGDNGDRNYDVFKRENPFDQANSNMMNIMNKLAADAKQKHRDALGIPYTSVIFFPMCDFTCCSPKYDNTYIDANYMNDNLEYRLKNIVKQRVHADRISGINIINFDKVVKEHLVTNIKTKPNIRPVLNTSNQEMIELTEEQAEILKHEKYNRAIIKGGPGTAKSILAAAKAEQLADAGYDVLLICYNKALARQLEKSISGRKNIITDAWCEYMYRLIAQAEPDYKKPDTEDLDTQIKFYHTELPAKFIEFIGQGRINEKRPNAIVLDEGQDLNTALLSALFEYIGPAIKDIPFIVFYDPDQNLFFKEEDTGPEYKKLISTEYTLPGTFRVSKEIRTYIKTVVPDYELQPSYVDFGEAGEYFYTSNEEQIKQINQVLYYLSGKSLHDNEIMLISYKHFEDSCVNTNLDGKTVINGRIDYTLLNELKENELLFYTVRTSKGLEADVVLLIDLPPKAEIKNNNPRHAQWFYIGASRARHFLFCFYERG